MKKLVSSNKQTSFDCGDLLSPEATTHLSSGVRIYFKLLDEGEYTFTLSESILLHNWMSENTLLHYWMKAPRTKSLKHQRN